MFILAPGMRDKEFTSRLLSSVTKQWEFCFRTHTLLTLNKLCSFVHWDQLCLRTLESIVELALAKFSVVNLTAWFVLCWDTQRQNSDGFYWGKQRNLQTHQGMWEVLFLLELDDYTLKGILKSDKWVTSSHVFQRCCLTHPYMTGLCSSAGTSAVTSLW